MRVRRARASDIPAITECYLRSWRAAYANELDEPELTREAEKRRAFDWSTGITAESAIVLVARDGDDTLGVIRADLALPAPRNLPEITMLYVDPQAWGTETAASLLTTAVNWISEQGHRTARLRVVEEHARARRFCEREGWTLDDSIAPAANDFHRLLYYRRDVAN